MKKNEDKKILFKKLEKNRFAVRMEWVKDTETQKVF